MPGWASFEVLVDEISVSEEVEDIVMDQGVEISEDQMYLSLFCLKIGFTKVLTRIGLMYRSY